MFETQSGVALAREWDCAAPMPTSEKEKPMTDPKRKELTEDELKKAAGGVLPPTEPGKAGDKGPRDASGTGDSAGDKAADRANDPPGISGSEGISGTV